MTKRLLAFCLFIVSPTSWALSLGDIAVLSYFAQPLHAEIAVPVFSEQELESLQVTLAPPARFEEAGLEFNSTVTTLQFVLRNRDDNTPYILVTTNKPINDLTISFIIQVDWNGGSFEKNYDILLSPPNVSVTAVDDSSPTPPATAQPIDVKPSDSESTLAIPVIEKLEAPPARAIPHAKITKKDNGDIVYGPVAPGESLSSIAEKISSYTSLAFEQRKLILYKLNRHAFANGRMDGLQAGYKLKFREMEVNPDDLDFASSDSRDSPSVTKPSPAPLSEIDMLEANRLRNEILEKREKLKDFRNTNDSLRKRLQELEQQVADRAHELGIPTQQRPAEAPQPTKEAATVP